MKKILVLLALAAGALLAQDLSQATGVERPRPAAGEPHTLVICQANEPDSLYLYGGADRDAGHIWQAIYDGPIDCRGFDYQPVALGKLPSLADGDAVINTVTVTAGITVVDAAGDVVELAQGVMVRPAGCRSADCEVAYAGGELAMDQMQARFVLVLDALWQDGTLVTAYDSAYSFELSRHPDTPAHDRYKEERTASYDAVDNYTVFWTGLPGYLDPTYFSNFWTPLPEHLWGGMTPAEIAESEEASLLPAGYGPFQIVEWVAGDHVKVVKNPNYFRAGEGLPYLDEVVFRFVGANPDAAIAALLAGDCDVLAQDIGLDEQAGLLVELEDQGLLNAAFTPSTAWEHVDFGINPVEGYSRPDFFEDARTRQAIAMCLDTQTAIDVLFYGRAVKLSSYVPPEHPLYNSGIPVWDYDPTAAQALLEQVGWRDDNGDGIREAHGVAGIPDGTLLTFAWLSNIDETRWAYMQMYQQNLMRCGIDLVVESMPAGEFFADGPLGPVFGRHFDMASFAWLTGVEPPCRLYLSDQIPSQENGWAGYNDPGFSDPDYDAACNAALQTLPGEPDYEQHHRDAQQIFAGQLPAVPLFLKYKIAASAPGVRGFIPDPTASSEMWNIEAFHFRYSISGQVLDGNGNPMEEVRVTAHLSGSRSRPWTTTDSQGTYTFADAVAGTYTLVSERDGFWFEPLTRTVTLPPDMAGQDFVVWPNPVSATLPAGTGTLFVHLTYTDTQELTTTLLFPPGVVSQTTTVFLTPTLAQSVPGFAFAGHAFELSVEPRVPDFVFNQPVTVTVHYSERDVRLVSDVSQLNLWWWPDTGWVAAYETCDLPLRQVQHRMDERALSVSICRPGLFGLFGPTHQVYLPLVVKGYEGEPLALTSPAPASSGVLYVAPEGECGGAAPCYATLQQALDQATEGDTVKLAAGVYTDVHGRRAPGNYEGPSVITQVAYISRTVIVRGGYTPADWDTADPEANPTTLDAGGQGRGLVVVGPVSPTLEGLRITGGDATGLGGYGQWKYDTGGGLYVYTATATISNNQIIDNRARYYGGGLYLAQSDSVLINNAVHSNIVSGQWDDGGGGLYLYYSDAVLRGNTVISNGAEYYGGGVYMYQSDAVVEENAFSDNEANIGSGGGLYLYNSAAVLISNTVTGNRSGGGGGAALSGSPATIESNLITMNEAGIGGGLTLFNSAATVSDNTIISNTGESGGGGVRFMECDGAVLTGNTVADNYTAYGSGGGGGLYYSDMLVSNNTIFSNVAEFDGGGLSIMGEGLTGEGPKVINNLVLSNTSNQGGGLDLQGNAVVTGNLIKGNETDFGGGGLAVSGGEPIIAENVIVSNQARGSGGGVIVTNASAMVRGNTFIANNSMRHGGGVYVYEDSVQCINNVITDNRSGFAGSGVYIRSSTTLLSHNTIARNTGAGGRGIYVYQMGRSSSVRLINTILVSQTVGIYVDYGNTVSIQATLWGTDTWGNGTDWVANGRIILEAENYWESPNFMAPDAGDYHLSPGSAAIDAGVPTTVTTDIDGAYRPQGLAPDLGADEAPGVALEVTKDGPAWVKPGEHVTYTLTVEDRGQVPVTGSLLVTDVVPVGAHLVGQPAQEVLTWTVDLTGTVGLPWQASFAVTTSQTITNDDYGVRAGGLAVKGTRAVVTYILGHRVYLPVVVRGLGQ